MKKLLAMGMAAALALTSAASAAVQVFVWEEGRDLYLEARGTLNLSGLTSQGSNEFLNGMIAGPSMGILGAAQGPIERYDVAGSFPRIFGNGAISLIGTFTGTNSFFTDVTASEGIIWVSEGFQSGDMIAASAFATRQSLDSIGARPGIYTWQLPADTITFRIGTEPEAVVPNIPAPPAVVLFATALLAAGWRRLSAQ
ncbi:MAG: hypothetical protein AAGH41_01160 [Pseudomonadota bacterium]